MLNPFRSLVRILGVCNKEILEVVRQPKLLLAAILGPLFLLILFGAGYRTERKTLRALFLARSNDPISVDVYRFLPELGPWFDFLGVTTDPEKARRLLRQKEVDLVVVSPPNAALAISRNEQAVFTMLHDEVNPEQLDYIRLAGEVFVDQLNHELLGSVVASERKQVHLDIQTGIETIRQLRTALEHEDLAAAKELQTSLNSTLDRIGHSLRARIESSEVSTSDAAQGILSTMTGIRSRVNGSLVPETAKRKYAEEIQQATNIENDLAVLSAQVTNLKPLDAQLMLAPFSSKTEGIVKAEPELAEYFSPRIVILLLQQLAILFAAISLVREFNGRKTEVLRLSPLRNTELLLGKYAGCLILSTLAASLLTVVAVYVLQVPMMGDWREYGAILGALMFSSLGIGFVISALSDTEAHAILYSTLLFIASMFFTGFFFDLDRFRMPLRVLCSALPATYGIRLLQDVMLRGESAGPLQLEVLLALGLAFGLGASLLSRRRVFLG